MQRYLIIFSSIMIIMIAKQHELHGGLIIGMNPDYSKIYSNELMSSGHNDSSIILLGFYSFWVSLVFYSIIKSQNIILYLINLFFFYFIIFLINLDVSIADSLYFGDHPLLLILIFSHIPLVFFLFKKIKEKYRSK